MIRRTLTALGAAALAGLVFVSLMAATGGIPSRPIFQTTRLHNGTAALPAYTWKDDTATGRSRVTGGESFSGGGTQLSTMRNVGANTQNETRLYSPRTDDAGGVRVEFLENDGTTIKGRMGYTDDGLSDAFFLENLEANVDAGVFIFADTGIINLTAGSGLGTFQQVIMDAQADQVTIETERLVHTRGGAEFRVAAHQFKRKTANTARVNTTTFATDPHLLADFSLSPGSTYIWELYLVVDAATADPDIKLRLACTNATGAFTMETTEATVGALTGTAHNGVSVGGMPDFLAIPITGTNDHHVRIVGAITPVEVCTPQLQWAQNTLDAADAVTLYTHSYMRITFVN